jgi:hypothetical protein
MPAVMPSHGGKVMTKLQRREARSRIRNVDFSYHAKTSESLRPGHPSLDVPLNAKGRTGTLHLLHAVIFQS